MILTTEVGSFHAIILAPHACTRTTQIAPEPPWNPYVYVRKYSNTDQILHK